jgi:hypothetical protein
MGKSAPKVPAAPDPNVVAAAQTKSNVDTANATAALNRTNQVTPQGTSTWSQGSGTPWNEQAYLQANPDVQQAVAAGTVKSGQDHYNQFGAAEGRQGAPQGYTPNAPWTQTVSLSPDQQRLYDQSVQGQQMYGDAALSQLGKLQGILSQPVNFSGQPGAGTAYNPGGALNPTITQDAYGAIAPTLNAQSWAAINPNIGYGAESRNRVETALQGRLQPAQDAQRAATETRLRNQGLVPGSEAYTNAMNDLGRQENDARLGIISQGGQEEQLQAGIANQLFGQQASNRDAAMQGQQALFGQQASNRDAALAGQQALFGQQVQGRQLGAQEQSQQFSQQNALRQQGIQEQLTQRQVPLNEISALLGGQQVQYPSLQNTPTTQVANTDVIGAYGNAQAAKNAQYQAQSQYAGAGNAGLASLLSAGIFGGLSGGANSAFAAGAKSIFG